MTSFSTSHGGGFSLGGFGLSLLAAVLVVLPSAAGAQVLPDSTLIPPDSTQLETPDDSLGLQEIQGDTINPQDTLPAVDVPELTRPMTEGWNTGTWYYDREEILGSKAINLADLLDEIPGLTPLRGGDYGAPTAVSGFGAGGGRIKVFKDGVEILPLEGSVADLARIGIAGLRSILILRGVGEIRIELESVLAEGGRPYSLIEAGTGDLNSNVLRGTFSHPRALGGVVALGIERLDTRGPRGEEPGVTQGAWIRYARPLFGSGILLADYASRSSDRGIIYSPEESSRADWSLRARWPLFSGLVGDLYFGSSSLKTDEFGTFTFDTETRRQLGAILAYDSERIQASGHLRRLSGEGIPNTTADLQVQSNLGRFGGVSGELTWESWEERSVSRNRIRAWSAPVGGLSFFAEIGSGEWGFPYLPALTPPAPDTATGDQGDTTQGDSIQNVLPGPRFADQGGSRFGAQFRWKGISLAGAVLKAEADSLFVMGLPTDVAGATQAGGSRNGFEVSARIPLYPKGFALQGWWQKWDQAEEAWTTPADTTEPPELVPEKDTPWRYLPRQSYQASLSFHNTFKESGNLEVWFDLGVRGRDPMAVPIPQEIEWEEEEEPRMVPSMVPFYQNWFVRVQIRIVTVRAYFLWENFTVRQQNQDYLGRILPATRSQYGVRWTLWN